MQIPERFVKQCEIGNHELDIRSPGIHQWTSGWVMQRTGGGGHGVSLPQRADRWACRYCVERITKGYQRDMFGAR
jgi:hypothetical protein